MNQELKLLRQVLYVFGKVSFECSHIGHRGGEYHTWTTPCPVEKNLRKIEARVIKRVQELDRQQKEDK